MKNFLEEFEKFAMRGNVVDLAVAVVIGAAFGKIVSSLVDNIITPITGILLGGISFEKLLFRIGDAEILYGAFIQSIVDFVIIAFAIFVAIKIMNRLQEKEEKAPEEEKSAPLSPEAKLLTEIRDELKNTN